MFLLTFIGAWPQHIAKTLCKIKLRIEYPGLIETVNSQQDFNYQLVLLAGKLIYEFQKYIPGMTSEYLKEKWLCQ